VVAREQQAKSWELRAVMSMARLWRDQNRRDKINSYTPKRRPNSDLRTREHLTKAEVERLMEAAKGNRYGHWDATMVLDLRSEQVDLRTATLHIRRVKKGTLSTHPSLGTSCAPSDGSSANKSRGPQ
jgi:hypothetical protein